MVIKKKTILNQFGEPVKVTLTERKYCYTIEVGGKQYACENNFLWAVQRFNAI